MNRMVGVVHIVLQIINNPKDKGKWATTPVSRCVRLLSIYLISVDSWELNINLYRAFLTYETNREHHCLFHKNPLFCVGLLQ